LRGNHVALRKVNISSSAAPTTFTKHDNFQKDEFAINIVIAEFAVASKSGGGANNQSLILISKNGSAILVIYTKTVSNYDSG